MKTYTEEQYKEHFPARALMLNSTKFKIQRWRYSGTRRCCSCIRAFPIYGEKAWDNGRCFENCDNCLGYGIPPITMDSLR